MSLSSSAKNQTLETRCTIFPRTKHNVQRTICAARACHVDVVGVRAVVHALNMCGFWSHGEQVRRRAQTDRGFWLCQHDCKVHTPTCRPKIRYLHVRLACHCLIGHALTCTKARVLIGTIRECCEQGSALELLHVACPSMQGVEGCAIPQVPLNEPSHVNETCGLTCLTDKSIVNSTETASNCACVVHSKLDGARCPKLTGAVQPMTVYALLGFISFVPQ